MASDTELFGEELTSPIIEEECHNDAEESSLDEPNSAKNISVEMETGKLKKKLGFVALFAYIFGGIIGSGIFISPVKVIQTVSTGGLVLGLWLAGGTIAVLGGVSYVELGSFVRNSGGEFVYIEKGFSFRGRKPFNVIGSLLSFSTIWTNVLILRPASISIIMLTFAEYLVRPFYPFYCEVPSVVMSLLAVAAIIALGLINSFTQKGASVLMIVFTAMKLLSMIFIILLGVERLASGDTQTLSDTFHAPLKSTATVGTIFGSLYGILWAYEAW
jgi:amino acid transporter